MFDSDSYQPEDREPTGGRVVSMARCRDDGEPVEISVVVPCFNEEENVGLLHGEIVEVLQSLGRAYEIIYVDDGSTDRTPERLRAIWEADLKVRVIRFRWIRLCPGRGRRDPRC